MRLRSGLVCLTLCLCCFVFVAISFPGSATLSGSAENVDAVIGHSVLAGETVPGVGHLSWPPHRGVSAAPDSPLGTLIASAAGPQEPTDQRSAIAYTQRFVQGKQQGTFQVSHEYRVPEHLRSLTVRLPPAATVTDKSGFSHAGNGTYEWTGARTAVSLTYRMPANRSHDDGDLRAASGEYAYVDAGEWAIVEQPRPDHHWTWDDQPVGLERSVRVAGEGAAGQRMVYFGPYREYTREAHGQQFRLIVPEATALSVDRRALLDSLAAASDTLRVGDRDDEVFVVAAPTEGVEWQLRGLQRGPADFWVQADEPLATPENVWLHEYVHTRQGYRLAPDLEWTREGTAVYYAALLSLEQGLVSGDAIRARLDSCADGEFGASTLSSPDTWEPGADYCLGALVASDLDRRLRLASDGERSLQTVLRRLNAREQPAAAETFVALLGSVGDGSVAAAGSLYTMTTERPSPSPSPFRGPGS